MALVTIVLNDFVYMQVGQYDAVVDALDALEGTVDVYPASAVEIDLVDEEAA